MNLLTIALKLVSFIEGAKGTIADIREVVARETPEDLAGFDAAIAAARQPAQAAANRATRENAGLED